MNISIQIDCETIDEYFETLRKLAAGAAFDVGTTEPAPAASSVVAMPTKGRKNKADAPKIVETKAEPEKPADKDPIDPQEDALGADEPSQTEVDDLAEKLEDGDDLEVKEPEGPKLTADNVRALAVRYANACAPGDTNKDPTLQDARRKAFAELTAHFGVQKFTEIAAERWPEVVAYVAEQRKTRKLPTDAVTD